MGPTCRADGVLSLVGLLFEHTRSALPVESSVIQGPGFVMKLFGKTHGAMQTRCVGGCAEKVADWADCCQYSAGWMSACARLNAVCQSDSVQVDVWLRPVCMCACMRVCMYGWFTFCVKWPSALIETLDSLACSYRDWMNEPYLYTRNAFFHINYNKTISKYAELW